jgi:uncharacterized protein YjeT (DUF2065 family)
LEDLFTAKGLLTALGLICLIEGAAYAFFPKAMRDMLATIGTWPPQKICITGTVAALAGICLLLAVRGF